MTKEKAGKALPLVMFVLGTLLAASVGAEPFDIAPFGRRCAGADTYKLTTTFDYTYSRSAPPAFEKVGERYIYALQWAEERDIKAVHLKFASPYAPKALVVQYWFQNWPYPPPTMPTIEDPVDDPWQGRWLTAKSVIEDHGQECQATFLPLAKDENPKAAHLAGVTYRRTLKVRLVSSEAPPALERVEVFTDSTQKTVALRIELGVSGKGPQVYEGRLEAYNGTVRNVRGWRTGQEDQVKDGGFRIAKGKGLIFEVHGAEPAPSGSHDITIVTLRAGDSTFSFAVPDAEKGPLYLPDFDSYVTLASDPRSFSPSIVKAGDRIRQKLAREPEQTYEHATREIPPLDPVERQGGRLYLPLALDSSWQKFALEWGGNVFLDKHGLKAKGAELRKLEWLVLLC